MLLKDHQVGIQTLLIAATITGVSAYVLNWYNTKRKKRIPQKWKPIGKVSDLFLYPLKSGHRVNLQTAECTITGLKEIKESTKYKLHDRTLVVYKGSAKECRTSRTNPKLVLIQVEVDDDNFLVVNAPEMKTLRLDIRKLLDKTRDDWREEILTFWIEEKFRIIDCGEEAALWVSRFLTEDNATSSDYRLGLHDGVFRRAISNMLTKFVQAYPKMNRLSLGIYSDIVSFMLINQASVDDIVARLPDHKISVHNFRPNIVVSDENLLPFEEDKWEWIKIGDAVFRCLKACTRCISTNVDPETGTRIKNLEPLRTLRTYRCPDELLKTDIEKDSPAMGIYLSLAVAGIINVGDTVSISIDD